MSGSAANRAVARHHLLLPCYPLPLASAQAMDVPIGCPECQPGPNPIGFRLTNDLGSSPGQLVACFVKIVHLEQGNHAGAAAPVELEISVAGGSAAGFGKRPGRGPGQPRHCARGFLSELTWGLAAPP